MTTSGKFLVWKVWIFSITVVSTGSTAVTGMCLGMRFSLVPITEPLLPSVITALRAPLSNIMMTAFSASSIVFTDNPVSSSACNRSYCQWGLSCKVHEMKGGGIWCLACWSPHQNFLLRDIAWVSRSSQQDTTFSLYACSPLKLSVEGCLQTVPGVLFF